QLAKHVTSPAAHPPFLQDSAGMGGACCKLRYFAADVDVAGRGRMFIITDVVGVAVPQLPRSAVSPTPHSAVLEQCARVQRARDQLDHSVANVDVAGRSGSLVIANGVAVGVTELSV